MTFYSNLNKTINTRKTHFSNKANIGLWLICGGVSGLLVMIFNFPSFLKYFISGIIGLFSYAVFACLIFVGIMLRKDKSLNYLPKKYVLIVLVAFFSLLSILHLACSVGVDYSTLGSYLSDIYKSQLSVGGVVLGLFVYLLKTLFTLTGTYIILSLLLLAMVALIVDYYFGFSGTKYYVKPKSQINYIEPQLGFDEPVSQKPSEVSLEENKKPVNIGLKAEQTKQDSSTSDLNISTKNFNTYAVNTTMDTFIKNFMPEKYEPAKREQVEVVEEVPSVSKRPPIFVHNDEFGNVDNTSTAWGSMNSPFSKSETKESLTNKEKNKRFLDATINRNYRSQTTSYKEPENPVKIQNAEESIKDLPMNGYVKSATPNNAGFTNFSLNSINKNEEEIKYSPAFIKAKPTVQTTSRENKIAPKVDGKELFNLYGGDTQNSKTNEVKVDFNDFPSTSRNGFKEIQSKAPEKPLQSSIIDREAHMADVLTKKEPAKEVKTEKPYKRPPKYKAPPIDLLNAPTLSNNVDKEALHQKAQAIEGILSSFKVNAKVTEITSGPQVTRFELAMPPGVSVNKINSLANDITAAVASRTIVRVEAPIPGKNAVGVEVPNDKSTMVTFREVLDSKEFWNSKSNTVFALGKEVDGTLKVCELNKMPHLLVAGTTGSGKSVCLNALILSILYKSSPEDVRLILVDPKTNEFSCYNDLPHLIMPKVITNPEKAVHALTWLVNEMEKRYQQFSATGCKVIEEFNQLPEIVEHKKAKMPYIVVIIDEFADLMLVASKELEVNIQRLTQKARACGIHVIIATQRPSADVITGIIKANLPSQIAFRVNNYVNSKIILDEGGAENLLGYGDMIYAPMGRKSRVQGCFVTNEEIKKVVDFVKENNTNYYDEEIELSIEKIGSSQDKESNEADIDGEDVEDADDELFKKCLKFVIETQVASGSILQRNFRIGYTRAGRMVDRMHKLGYIGPQDGAKRRAIYITMDQFKKTYGLDED